MNLAMTLTMDGLLRALRWRAHTGVEEIAAIRRRRDEPAEPDRPADRRRRIPREEPDGQPRR